MIIELQKNNETINIKWKNSSHQLQAYIDDFGNIQTRKTK
jgi:hypothetical protein